MACSAKGDHHPKSILRARIQKIIYIGRTHSKGGLKKLLRQFCYHVYGKRSPHHGGQAILLLDCSKTIHWAAVEDDAGAEHKLIEAFQQRTKRYPFGNRMRSARKAGAVGPAQDQEPGVASDERSRMKCGEEGGTKCR
jgi:hypothetical protein